MFQSKGNRFRRKPNGQFNGSESLGASKSLFPTRKELRIQRKLEKAKARQASESLPFDGNFSYPTLSEINKNGASVLAQVSEVVPSRFAPSSQASVGQKTQTDFAIEEQAFLESDMLTIMDSVSASEGNPLGEG
jgi:hypothetical protein